MEHILNWIKLPQKVSWPILFVSTLLLWGPDSFQKGLGLDLFINKYRIWIGVAFLFFLATAFSHVITSTFPLIKSHLEKRKLIKYCKERLTKLTQEEKVLLKHYIFGNTRSRDLDIQNGVVSGLIKTGFISVAFNTSYGGKRGSYTFPVNISEWAWDYLQENQNLLE